MTEAFKQAFKEAFKFAEAESKTPKYEPKHKTMIVAMMKGGTKEETVEEYLTALFKIADELEIKDGEFLLNWLSAQAAEWDKKIVQSNKPFIH